MPSALERVSVPGCKPVDELEAGLCTGDVVVGEVVATVELKAGDQESFGHEVARTRGDERRLCAGFSEQRDVAGHDDDVEGATQVERGEVMLLPLELRSESACGVDHRRVDVDTDDLDVVAGEVDGDSPGTAPGVEDGGRVQRSNERGLAVHVLAVRGECVETRLVLVAVEVHPPERMAGRWVRRRSSSISATQ